MEDKDANDTYKSSTPDKTPRFGGWRNPSVAEDSYKLPLFNVTEWSGTEVSVFGTPQNTPSNRLLAIILINHDGVVNSMNQMNFRSLFFIVDSLQTS